MSLNILFQSRLNRKMGRLPGVEAALQSVNPLKTMVL
jgi:hypothetical protein